MIRLLHHSGALALFAAAQAGASSAQALTIMSPARGRDSASGAAHGAPSAQQLPLRSRPAGSASASDAAQPASASNGAAQPAWSSGNAAQPPLLKLSANAPELTVGFYNLGIQLSEFGGAKWKNKEPKLASDLVKAFVTHELDILCLSELGELGVGLEEKIPEGVDAWIRKLLANSAVPPVDIYTNGNYTTIVAKTSRVVITDHKLVNGFMPHKSDRCYQHFRVRVQGDSDTVSIINCHAPSSSKRHLTNAGRERYFRSFHCESSPDRFIWGGDFNTNLILLSTLMREIDPRYNSEQDETSSAAQPGPTPGAAQTAGMQLIFSHLVGWRHGDVAITFGLYSFQVNSKVGVSQEGASDAHDLVVVKVFCTDRRKPVVASANRAAGSSSSSEQLASADQPLPPPLKQARSASSSSTESVPPVVPSTAAPEEHVSVSERVSVLEGRLESLKVGKNKVPTIAEGLQHPLGLPKKDASAPSTATEPVQPVVLDEHASNAEQLAAPRHKNLATPLVNQIFGTDDVTMAPLQELLEKIAKDFLFGKLANIVATETGCYTSATALNVLTKLEAFLRIMSEQRARYLSRHPDVLAEAVFNKNQMETLHSEWMHDYHSWMNADTIELYEKLKNGKNRGDHQKAHQKLKGSFSAFLFQIIGNKHVLLASIQHPICTAAQPEVMIQKFMTACEQEKDSVEYKQRKQISERCTEERKALKKAAHKARQDLVKARKIMEAPLWSLSKEDQTLVTDFQSGHLERIRDDCDQAFGWNQQMRTDMGSTASRMTTVACQQLLQA
jgi:hypothetical protein